MKLIDRLHERVVHPRRVRVLCDHLVALIPQNARVLDVGCGDGLVAYLLSQKRPDIQVKGVDILVRENTRVPVEKFDGEALPYGDASLDVVMFIDTLHHMENPAVLLREGARIARQAIVIKDHLLSGAWAGSTLRFMDWVGNARHGVKLTHTYWPKQKWFETCDTLGMKMGTWKTELKLYPWPANWIFERSLHFIARLEFP